jgi:hypothetical protein
VGTFHEFFFDHKWVGLLVFLIGATYAGYLYFRSYEQWVAEKRNQGSKVPQIQRKPSQSSAAGRVVHPPQTGDGQQEDLLARLAREEEDERAKSDNLLPDAAPTVRSTRSDLKPDPAYRSTNILKRASDEEDEGQGEDRTPLQNAIRAAVEESLEEDAGVEGLDETGQDSALTRRVATDDPEADAAATEIEDEQTTTGIEQRRGSASHAEILRRAKRHEELGLHREIQADHLEAGDVRRISDDERKRRLSELGISMESNASEDAEERNKRLGTAELDDILGRLDAALTDVAESDAPAETTPEASEDASATAAPEPEPAVASTDEDAEAAAETPVNSPEPTQLMSDDDQAAASAAAGDDQTLLMDSDTESGHSDAASAIDALFDAGNDETPAPAAEETASSDSTPTDSSADTDDADDDDDAASDDVIPDWARADTFDDEPGTDSNGEPEQQKLF